VSLVLAELFVRHGRPAHIRSDTGPEFLARHLKTWLKTVLGVEPLSSEPGSPWENGSCESFNGKRRAQLLNGELCSTLKEAHIIIERWRTHDNTVRPPSSLGGQPPAPEAIQLAS
jgi:putative transposase